MRLLGKMGDKLKVLFFISSLAGGGAERVMVNLLASIDGSRIEPVLVLLYPAADSPYRKYLSNKIKVIIVERVSDSIFEKIKQFMSFIRCVHKESPRIMLSMLTHNNIMAICAGVLLGIKVIACEHITLGEIIKTGQGSKMLGVSVATLTSIFYRIADQVIAVSEGIKRNLIEEFHIPANKIRVIYNPIDCDAITTLSVIPPEHPFFKGKEPVIVGVGRLVQQKRFDILIRAFCSVMKEIDARLIILGEGPEREALRKLVGDYGMEEKVSLAGFQKNPYQFLSKSDVFVLSSGFEGLPMVILEAMACGAPVISTDCRSGPREILQNGKCGLLVPVGDEVALSKGIVTLLRDRALRENFSKAGKERAKDFSAGEVSTQYNNMLLEVASGSGLEVKGN
jgi:glycosyltransferase involved in cell wall biosynthesis